MTQPIRDPAVERLVAQAQQQQGITLPLILLEGDGVEELPTAIRLDCITAVRIVPQPDETPVYHIYLVGGQIIPVFSQKSIETLKRHFKL